MAAQQRRPTKNVKTKLEQWREVRESVRNLNRTLDTLVIQFAAPTQVPPEMADLFEQLFGNKKTHAAS